LFKNNPLSFLYHYDLFLQQLKSKRETNENNDDY